MRSTVLVVGAAAAVALTAVALVALLPSSGQVGQAAPGEEVGYGFERRVLATNRFCGDCHYGVREIWNQGEVLEDGNETVELRFSNAYNVTELFAIEVFEAGRTDVELEPYRVDEGDLAVGQSTTVEVDVPENASGLLLRTDAQVPPPTVQRSVWGRWQYNLTLSATAPDGTTFDAREGDGRDLRVLALDASQLEGREGTWTVELTLADGQRPVGHWVLRSHVSTAETFVAHVPFGDVAAVERPFDADANYTVRLWPYHDHTDLENYDWDPFDMSPFVVHVEPTERDRTAAGPDVEAIWGNRSEVVVLDRNYTEAAVWWGTPSRDDPGLGRSYPMFGPTGDPVPPGTSWVDFELTWTNAEVNPAPRVEFSPAGTASFLEPVLGEDEAGERVFTAKVRDPSWWDEMDEESSDWDIAPYVPEDEGETNRFVGEMRLVVTARRGGPQPQG